MISKMKPVERGRLAARHRLQRLAAVHRRRPGRASSEIRRWIIENDWLEAVVALPDQLFYNTGDFIDIAESVGLMPKIDNLAMFRCVQVTRRLLLKSRDVGLFCNVSSASLTDALMFRQFLDFMDANRALASSLMFEFTQEAYRNFGPIEHESLAALAERGFRFSMDHVTDLHMEPNELANRAFRFLKVPAKLLLNKAASNQATLIPRISRICWRVRAST